MEAISGAPSSTNGSEIASIGLDAGLNDEMGFGVNETWSPIAHDLDLGPLSPSFLCAHELSDLAPMRRTKKTNAVTARRKTMTKIDTAILGVKIFFAIAGKYSIQKLLKIF